MGDENFDHLRSRQFGYAVTLRRTALQMDRKQLASDAQLSYPYICEIEKGVKDPSARSLRALAAALGFETPSDLLRWVDEHPLPSDTVKGDESGQDDPPGLARRSWGRSTTELAASPVRRAASQPVAAAPSLAAHEIEQLREVIISTVKLEISSWLRSELPHLIQDEIARQLEEHGL